MDHIGLWTPPENKQPPKFPPAAATQRAIMLLVANFSKPHNRRDFSNIWNSLPTVRMNFFYNGLMHNPAPRQGPAQGVHGLRRDRVFPYFQHK